MAISMAAGAGEPRPIEAEFESAYLPGDEQPEAPRGRFAPPPLRNRNVTVMELAGGCIASAVIAVILAVAATGAGSGGGAGIVAVDVNALKQGQADLVAAATQITTDMTALRARIDAQADRLVAREDTDQQIRDELVALTGQVSAISGAGPASVGIDAGATPLGALLARISKLEASLAADTRAPQTSAQAQRALRELADKVTALDAANSQLTAALNKRQLATTALETSLAKVQGEVATLKAQKR